jgi:CheY-like chemotaxis protein
MIHFSVQDDGIGVSSVDQQRLFQSFSQANSDVSRTYGGTGLGLAVARSLVELMGGEIWVESTAGYGATFHFTIATASALIAQKHHQLQEDYHNRRIISIQRAFAGKTAAVRVTEPRLAQNLSIRLAALGLVPQTGAAEIGTPPPDILLSDDLERTARTKVPSIGIGWLRPPDFTGEFVRKPIRSKHLIDTMRRMFNLPPIEVELLAGQEKQRFIASAPAPARFCRILLVDDNVLNRKIARHMLEQLGYQSSCIYTASNGVEALASIAQQMFDIVMMDLEMPIMNGEDATRKVRSTWKERPDRPYIIGATASATLEAKERCSACGMNAFLGKPYRFDTLAAIFETAALTL